MMIAPISGAIEDHDKFTRQRARVSRRLESLRCYGRAANATERQAADEGSTGFITVLATPTYRSFAQGRTISILVSKDQKPIQQLACIPISHQAIARRGASSFTEARPEQSHLSSFF